MANNPKKQYRYKDLDMSFKPHPVTGDIIRKFDAEAIKRSVKLLVLTEFYGRLFDPEKASGTRSLLFENITPATAGLIEQAIFNAIRNYEPRADISEVTVVAKPDDNQYEATIIFNILNIPEPIEVSMVLERTR
ncbi:MAG: hypothetical protein BV459_00545 [Thermoplasmata archaeon M11B2D]|nr:MAG: hypothetical protein BV459_00545 [Thermoplasmata archaeon M11B2D]